AGTGSAFRRPGWLIELNDAKNSFDSIEERTAGYDRAGAYITSRSHTLIAAFEPDTDNSQSGFKELLAARADLEQRPPENLWPLLLPRRTIRMDFKNRQIKDC